MLAVVLAAAFQPLRAQETSVFSSQGLAGSEGVVVRVRHPSHWKKVELDDEMALAELRGTRAGITGILQVGRGRLRQDMASACAPGRARTMLQNLAAEDADARVTDVVARSHGDRAAYEVRYERRQPPAFLAVRSLIVCLKDSRIVVSCGAQATAKHALADMEPVCREVLESVSISED